MARIGYIERQGGVMRMRWVKPGADANNENTPANQVIFDTKALANASILEVGQAPIPKLTNSTIGTTGTWIRTWSYPFVPFCIFSFASYGVDGSVIEKFTDTIQVNTTVGSSDVMQPIIRVSKTGIWIRFEAPGAGNANPAIIPLIRWIAFRMSAV